MLHYGIHVLSHLRLLIRWIFLALVAGVVAGGVGAAFAWGMTAVTNLRTQHPWLLLLLPVSGLAIVALYRACHFEKDSGTNTVLAMIHAEKEIPARMAPLIFISTRQMLICSFSSP